MPSNPARATSAAGAIPSVENSFDSFICARSWNPVPVGPGQRQVTVTPVPAVSLLSASENDSTYAFDA
jgi:hypothetical protein